MELIPLKNGKLLVLREAEPDDAMALIAFSKRIGAQTDFLLTDAEGWRKSVEEQREILAASLIAPGQGLFLHCIEGEIVGLFSLYPFSKHARTKHTAAFGIALDESCWGLGIGPISMALAIDWTREWGYHKLYLEAHAENARALALYHRFGFAECGRRKEHLFIDGQYKDEILMELML